MSSRNVALEWQIKVINLFCGSSFLLSRELTEPAGGARKMKSAGRRGNIGPSAGLVILEPT